MSAAKATTKPAISTPAPRPSRRASSQARSGPRASAGDHFSAAPMPSAAPEPPHRFRRARASPATSIAVGARSYRSSQWKRFSGQTATKVASHALQDVRTDQIAATTTSWKPSIIERVHRARGLAADPRLECEEPHGGRRVLGARVRAVEQRGAVLCVEIEILVGIDAGEHVQDEPAAAEQRRACEHRGEPEVPLALPRHEEAGEGDGGTGGETEAGTRVLEIRRGVAPRLHRRFRCEGRDDGDEQRRVRMTAPPVARRRTRRPERGDSDDMDDESPTPHGASGASTARAVGSGSTRSCARCRSCPQRKLRTDDLGVEKRQHVSH